jgi:hypothetical protein
MEHLRYIARANGVGQHMLADETAMALRTLARDPAELLVAARRITERHPLAGCVWWVCAHAVTAAEPSEAMRRCVAALGDDTTADSVAAHLDDDSTVVVCGWGDLASEVAAQRGDLRWLVVDPGDDAAALHQKMRHLDVDAELVVASSLAPAVLAADVVLLEPLMASPSVLVTESVALAVASTAYCAGVSTLACVGVGRVLPEATISEVLSRIEASSAFWELPVATVPLALCSTVLRSAGVVATPLVADAPPTPELLRRSPM